MYLMIDYIRNESANQTEVLLIKYMYNIKTIHPLPEFI